MYIKFYNEQQRVDDIWGRRSQPDYWGHNKDATLTSSHLPPSTFRPTLLVRISDMKVVRGETVGEGYCAFSYSWNWSGDVVPNDDGDGYHIVDDGLHEIIHSNTEDTQSVEFKDLIQHISNAFNIRYIWFDQMCIDQNDPEQKKHELRQMHLIYKHAIYTMALIPEFRAIEENDAESIFDTITNSEWCKRFWTLEEAFMSQRLLIVGSNVHMWSDIADRQVSKIQTRSNLFLYSVCTKEVKWNASTTLWHARGRTSTNAHDRVFALANMFPGVVDRIHYGYDQDLLKLMTTFYVRLLETDLSVLCFGAPLETDAASTLIRLDEERQLPSWTGISGLHIPQRMVDDGFLHTSFNNFELEGSSLIVTCECIPISLVERPVAVQHFRPWHLIDFDDNQERPLRIYPPSDDVSLPFVARTQDDSPKDFDWFTETFGLKTTHWIPIRKKNEAWIPTLSSTEYTAALLSLTEETCTECLILSGISFNIYGYHNVIKASPVVTRHGNAYKDVGLCFLSSVIHFDPPNIETTRTVIVE